MYLKRQFKHIENCMYIRTVSSTHHLEISMQKLEGKVEASFDTPFITQSHAESKKKIVGAL